MCQPFLGTAEWIQHVANKQGIQVTAGCLISTNMSIDDCFDRGILRLMLQEQIVIKAELITSNSISPKPFSQALSSCDSGLKIWLHQPPIADVQHESGKEDCADSQRGRIDKEEAAHVLRDSLGEDQVLPQYACKALELQTKGTAM